MIKSEIKITKKVIYTFSDLFLYVRLNLASVLFLLFFWFFYAPALRCAFRFALVHPSIRPSIWKFCDKDGKVGASVSYGHISSLFLCLGNIVVIILALIFILRLPFVWDFERKDNWMKCLYLSDVGDILKFYGFLKIIFYYLL